MVDHTLFALTQITPPKPFWQWAVVLFKGIKPTCRHDLFCLTSKVKKEDRLFCCCPYPRENACDFFEWKLEEDPLESFCTTLFSMPPSYRLTVKEIGETFMSRVYEEFLHQILQR